VSQEGSLTNRRVRNPELLEVVGLLVRSLHNLHGVAVSVKIVL